MAIYKFYDSDNTGHGDYDITGDCYRILLETCFKYSSTVSFLVLPKCTDRIEEWEKYRIPITCFVQNAYRHYGPVFPDKPNQIGDYEIRHYRLEQGLQNLLISHVDSVFKWICGWGYNNPNDPTFFRQDGSVFFFSTIHEGECTLLPNKNETVSHIVTGEHWVVQEDGM